MLRTSYLRVALVAVAVVCAGCKTQPHVNAHIESVNAEYRQLEDYVYALEADNARLQQELDAARQGAVTGTALGGAAPQSRGGMFRRSPPASGSAPRRSPAADAAPPVDGPVIELPGESAPPPSAPGSRSRLQRPETESFEPSAPADTPPDIDLPRPASPNLGPQEIHELLPVPSRIPGTSLPAPVQGIPVKPADTKVTHLYLNPTLTAGTDFDGQPGDDGVRIVVEPRNAGDEYVPEAGALSVVVLDPERDGDAARVARWDFDASAARELLAESSPGKGLKLEMPWPARAPAANRLKLFVRYETSDGRRLQADREIFVTQPGQGVGAWTPRLAATKSEIQSTKHETNSKHE